MNNDMRFRRRTYLVNRALQLRFVALLMLQMGLVLVFLSILVYSHVLQTTSIANTIPFVDSSLQTMFQDEIQANVFGFFMRSLVLVTATAILLVVFGISASHKLAGPVVKLERFLNDIADGNSTERIRFRRDDNLDDFADSMNHMVESIEQRRARPRQIAARFLKSRELPDSTFERGHALAEIEGLVLEMKGAL